ncbi:peptidase [Bifidobacterium samirii]|uniref:LPXTG-motif cell wall anchor domain-containing protein n=1 Tax=Bifidobacterium samirii TaxID=2306974 RepID=A0A430FR40_9BIFI|nr:peptidase [Bifidobacterium samirii]RSX55290.1 LPXTG-motif cell wall anchor domain-containing protein [Bifidobacterium samirii]
MISTLRRNAVRAALALLAATIAVMTTAAGVAHAAQRLDAAPEGTYVIYEYNGSPLYLGVTAVGPDGTRYYCRDVASMTDYTAGDAVKVEGNDATKRIAWLMERYRTGGDTITLAAIGALVHDHFDVDPAAWASYSEQAYRAHGDVKTRAAELWEEAGRSVPADITVERSYAQGLRTGTVTVGVNADGGTAVAGVPYRVELQGPAVFDDGGQTVTGTTTGSPITIGWKATGDGDVTVTPSYDYGALDSVTSAQDFIRPSSEQDTTVGTAISFRVRQRFTPTIATTVAARIVDAGEPVEDTVTVGVAGDDDHWPDGVDLHARGWYFDGIDDDAIADGPTSPTDGETAAAFLQRLADSGYEPSAYGTATFDHPGQQATVTATTRPDGGTAYAAPADGRHGTWVWAIERDRQDASTRDYLAGDTVSPFLDIAETTMNRTRLSVESTATEHTAVVGSELSDTITVAGFPADHGEYTGSDTLGIDADQPYAQVSVWWSGDPDDPTRDDDHRPTGTSVPQEDANHRLIGTWDYPAVNGRIRVGGGSPDAYGDPVTITADTHGWYVFIWSFAGDGRVMPAASAYDDAWERVRVHPVDTPEPEPVTLTTQVSADTVDVDEPFHDVAHITGPVPEGAYVTFTAYEAIAEGEEPGRNGMLLDNVRAEADPNLTDQLVTSPETRSPTAGIVYWKATLYSKDGDILATHDLGAEGEMVTVREPDEPLPHTGTDTTLVAGAALALLGAGMLAFAVSRRPYGTY